mmetsp:Transcript_9104/g.16381  ORF Transcript_9104/g.16381 Transcript_9104/m.16381 type:complete len:179 (-) Transcript_9104:857-1393(-)
MKVSSLKVDELRKELRARGLDTSGNKATLVSRLQEVIDRENEGDRVGGGEEVKDVEEEGNGVEESGESERKSKKVKVDGSGVKDGESGVEKKEVDGEGGGGDEEVKRVEEEEEKRKKRAERFGVEYTPSKSAEELKKKLRAQRFQLNPVTEKSTKSVGADAEELERRRKRAERFTTKT